MFNKVHEEALEAIPVEDAMRQSRSAQDGAIVLRSSEPCSSLGRIQSHMVPLGNAKPIGQVHRFFSIPPEHASIVAQQHVTVVQKTNVVLVGVGVWVYMVYVAQAQGASDQEMRSLTWCSFSQPPRYSARKETSLKAKCASTII